MQPKWLLVFVVVLCVAACGGASAQKPNPPVSVKCSIIGEFGIGRSWSLEVKPNGAATLSIDGYPGNPKPKKRNFKVRPAQFAELIRVIGTEHFFELTNQYGGDVPDSDTRTLSIVLGHQRKTITLRFLQKDDPKLPEIKRAIRVWNTIRQWFNDVDAVDLRPYDQRLLDAP